MAAGLYARRDLKLAHEWKVYWPGGDIFSRMICVQTWYQTINMHLYLLFIII